MLSLKEKLKNIKEGPGSMAAYLEMRELEIQKEIPQAESEMPDLQSQPGKHILLCMVQLIVYVHFIILANVINNFIC